MDRRALLASGLAAGAAALMPRGAQAEGAFAPTPGAWRRFAVTTRLDIAKPEGATQAWLPLASVQERDWFRAEGADWRTNGKATVFRDGRHAPGILRVEWQTGEKTPYVELTSKVATRDRAVDFSRKQTAALSPAERKYYLAATELIPTDGIVRQTADKIVAGARNDIDKARAIYEWVVDNSYRRAATRGCGIGDIASMLKSGDLGGKCADLNALFVGLARASGVPARDVYGIRIAPSKFGYKSLGANSDVITKAQHCRAEVFLDGYGWVAMDPADVRKVVLEEPPGNLPLADAKVAAARKALFGSWETNWLAYNFAHDVALPGSSGPKIGFLMYPQAETAGARLDCLDPDNFRYTIKTKETTAI
ncbi:MAG TPA: transglutaminase-like domain-containing protein [Rhodoblastus sp.]|nr:transglutaminase-like domain-containing protein [Rhodoblastus sp.]